VKVFLYSITLRSFHFHSSKYLSLFWSYLFFNKKMDLCKYQNLKLTNANKSHFPITYQKLEKISLNLAW